MDYQGGRHAIQGWQHNGKSTDGLPPRIASRVGHPLTDTPPQYEEAGSPARVAKQSTNHSRLSVPRTFNQASRNGKEDPVCSQLRLSKVALRKRDLLGLGAF